MFILQHNSSFIYLFFFLEGGGGRGELGDHFVYAIWAPNKFSVSNFDNALLCFEL